MRIAWQSFGDADEAVVLVPTWNFVDSRVSAHQVPDLARRFRVLTYDARGSGASDHPETGYRFEDHAADALAVMDAAGVERALVVAASAGVNAAILAATRNPERIDRLVLVAPAIRMEAEADVDRATRLAGFHAARATYDGWERWNADYWRRDWSGFARWFLGVVFNEPGSEQLVEDILEIALQADVEMLIRQQHEFDSGAAARELGNVRSPTLVIQGDRDLSVELALGEAVAEAIPGAVLCVVEGGGHRPDNRSPRLVNPVLIEFLAGGLPASRPGLELRAGRGGASGPFHP